MRMSLRMMMAAVFAAVALASGGCSRAPAAAGLRPQGGVPSGTEALTRHLVIPGVEAGSLLAGQLSIPVGGGPRPAVVLITGNGPHTREQTTSGTPVMRLIGDHLVSRGFAVLSTDPRGHGLSSGPGELETTSADRAEDTRLWLRELRRQRGVDGARIALLGHSEGGMIALMLAAEGEAWAACLLGTPGEPGAQVWINQQAGNLAKLGGVPEIVEAVAAAFEPMTGAAARGFDSDGEYYALGRQVLLAHGLAEDAATEALVDQVMSDLRTPWYRCFLGWDPSAHLPRVNIPLLAVWGGLDEQVPPERNTPAFHQWAESHPELGAVVVLGNEDHFFLRRAGLEPGSRHDYGRMHVSEELLELVSGWLSNIE